jgi:cytochrome P450
VTHDSKYFKDLMDFNPERWLDPKSQDVKEASQPFSLGPRGCLGRKLVVIAVLLFIT